MFSKEEYNEIIVKILQKHVKVTLYQNDGFYWLKINNGPMHSISREEYIILKDWRKKRGK